MFFFRHSILLLTGLSFVFPLLNLACLSFISLHVCLGGFLFFSFFVCFSFVVVVILVSGGGSGVFKTTRLLLTLLLMRLLYLCCNFRTCLPTMTNMHNDVKARRVPFPSGLQPLAVCHGHACWGVKGGVIPQGLKAELFIAK